MSKEYNKPQILNINNTGVVKKCSKCGKEFVVNFRDINNNICDKCKGFENNIKR